MDEPAPLIKIYITPGLHRLKDELQFLLNKERPAVTKVVTWAASNGDRSENADYQYSKRRLCQIDGQLPYLTSESMPRRWWTRKLRGWVRRRSARFSERRCAIPMPREQSAW